MELAGKVVVVTGAGNGIGRALARRFHAAEAGGVVVADLDAAAAQAVATELDARRPGSAIACISRTSRAWRKRARSERRSR